MKTLKFVIKFCITATIAIIMACVAYNAYAKTKIKPAWESVYMFLAHNDTIILEPLEIHVGTALVSNFDEVGTEIQLDDDWDKLVAEFCKSKWIKVNPTDLCTHVEKVENILFVIIPGKGYDELMADLNKIKNEKDIALYHSLYNSMQ